MTRIRGPSRSTATLATQTSTLGAQKSYRRCEVLTKEQRDAIEYARRERRQYLQGQDVHLVTDDDDDPDDYWMQSRLSRVHRKTASRLWRELADTCADCGGSTAVGTPDPHVCGE
jgi:hypothetical protein